MPNYHVRITAPNREALADLVRRHKVTVARHTAEETPDGYRVYAHAGSGVIEILKAAGYRVEEIENADEAGQARQTEYGGAAAKATITDEELTATVFPRYLSVSDVERALALAASPTNAAFISLIPLPNKTWENRQCHAVRVGKGAALDRPGIYLLGGVHAREWGSPDILVSLLVQLIGSYRNNSAITIGGNTFTADQIRTLIEKKSLYLFPQANPDGRNFSMTQDAMWRKNRRPAPPHSTCGGVDINRNYDFLWNYPTYFAPSAPVCNSTNPCDEIYIGPGAVSEPETKNAVWMMENHPDIRYMVDLHSYSESILYEWGDDDDQGATPSMNFQNPAYNGKRGITGDTVYKEYITVKDSQTALQLAKTMQDAIRLARGRSYAVKQSVGLYPTAGTSCDYAFSRHITNPGMAKISSFTIEWGSPSNPTPFHPPYPEMQKIIQEITAALLSFCLAAT